MAIALSKLAQMLCAEPIAAFQLLEQARYLSDGGLRSRQQVEGLIQACHAMVTAEVRARGPNALEITGPQPTARYQSLALDLDARGYLSPLGKQAALNG